MDCENCIRIHGGGCPSAFLDGDGKPICVFCADEIPCPHQQRIVKQLRSPHHDPKRFALAHSEQVEKAAAAAKKANCQVERDDPAPAETKPEACDDQISASTPVPIATRNGNGSISVARSVAKGTQYDRQVFVRFDTPAVKETVREVATKNGVSLSAYVAHFAVKAAEEERLVPADNFQKEDQMEHATSTSVDSRPSSAQIPRRCSEGCGRALALNNTRGTCGECQKRLGSHNFREPKGDGSSPHNGHARQLELKAAREATQAALKTNGHANGNGAANGNGNGNGHHKPANGNGTMIEDRIRSLGSDELEQRVQLVLSAIPLEHKARMVSAWLAGTF
jgi:hypothetical protein